MRFQNKIFDVYAWLLRRCFLLPGWIINTIFQTVSILARPLLRSRNYRQKIDEIVTRLATKNHPYIQLFHRVARDSNWKYWRALAVNFIVGRLILGVDSTLKLKNKGIFWPSTLAISVTSRCNLHCRSCYASRFSGADLPAELVDRIISEAKRGGTYTYSIIGGEPSLRLDLWPVFERHSDVTFMMFTNGTLIDEEFAKKAALAGNIYFNLSLDGFEATNDARRGKGVFAKVMQAMKILAKEKIAFGVSVAINQQSFDEVTSPRFINMLIEQGCLSLCYMKHLPTSNADRDLELDDAHQVFLRVWIEHLNDSYPLYVRIGEVAARDLKKCDAARRHMHIAPNGDVEPCLFCPVAADNIKGKSIGEVMNSGYFQRLRALNECSQGRFSKLIPCLMYHDPGIKGQIIELKEVS